MSGNSRVGVLGSPVITLTVPLGVKTAFGPRMPWLLSPVRARPMSPMSLRVPMSSRDTEALSGLLSQPARFG